MPHRHAATLPSRFISRTHCGRRLGRSLALLWALLVLPWLLGSGPVRAEHGPSHSLILATESWKDESGLATLAQAQGQDFKPFAGEFTGGYTTGAHWLRVRLKASAEPIALRLSPPWVDEITVFDPAQPGSGLTAGDRHPLGRGAESVLGFALTLPASTEPRDLMIQLRSTSSHKLLVQALPGDLMSAVYTRVIVWTSIYAAVMLVLLMALLSILLMQPQWLVGSYLLRHLAYTIYGVMFLGLPQMLLEGQWPDAVFDTGFSISVVILPSLALWFDLLLLRGFQPRHCCLSVLKLCMWISPVLLLLLLSGYVREALQFTVLSLFPVSLALFVAAVTVRPHPSTERLISKRVLLIYYLLVLGSLFLGLPSVLGWVASKPWTQYLLILHGVVSGIAMTVILYVRGQRMHRMNQQFVWRLQQAQHDADRERQRREEQSQFLNMLMHELKTPLAVVSAALGTRDKREENLSLAGNAVRDMRAILERCVQIDQVDQLALEQRHQKLDLAAVVNQVTVGVAGLGQRLHLQAAPDLPQLYADEQLLKIVLSNLIENAHRYSQPLTPIEVQIKTATVDRCLGLQMRIRNSPGPAGWPDPQKIFTKYYRSSGAQRGSGSGLGLYLARQLARSLGGSLDYLPDGQVQFILWLPTQPA